MNLRDSLHDLVLKGKSRVESQTFWLGGSFLLLSAPFSCAAKDLMRRPIAAADVMFTSGPVSWKKGGWYPNTHRKGGRSVGDEGSVLWAYFSQNRSLDQLQGSQEVRRQSPVSNSLLNQSFSLSSLDGIQSSNPAWLQSVCKRPSKTVPQPAAPDQKECSRENHEFEKHKLTPPPPSPWRRATYIEERI